MANIKCLRIIFCVSVITVAIIFAHVTRAINKGSETASAPTKMSTVENKDRNKRRKDASKSQQVPRSKGCDAKFGKTLEENMDKIKSYNLSQADPYFHDLDSHDAPPEVILKGPGTSNIEIPVVATGASSNHYKESLMMLKKFNSLVRPAYKTIRLYYYDLGLETEQRTEVMKQCNCTFLKFPFEEFPPHVRQLKAYCWKPLIIKMMTKISQFVMWMDASIRFKTPNLDPLFVQGKRHGILLHHNAWKLPAFVHRDTFAFLEETPCLYNNFTQFNGGFVIYHSAINVAKRYIIDPWVKCALIEDCMKTKHETQDILKCRSHRESYRCHRFDQAVISILMTRLFHKSFKEYNIGTKYFMICNGERC